MIKDRLAGKEFEFNIPLLKSIYYKIERCIGNRLVNKPPPQGLSPNLLNLGCGPLIYHGWVNADEYAFKRGLREKDFRPDWRLDITQAWNCPDNHWDGIFTQHVIEHVPYSAAVFVLAECYRTLKPGAWLRVSVPDLRKYIDFYEGRSNDPFFKEFRHRALAISFLTQMHMHKSAWDGDLMVALLSEIGFVAVCEVGHGAGTDQRLIKDQDVKRPESLYVEARKPFETS